MQGAAKVIEAVYEAPYLAHAPMEPLNATVQLAADRLDVWMGSQNALGTLQTAAQVSGLRPEQVYVHNCFCRRRLRPPHVQRRDDPGDQGRQGCRQARQARLDARGGYPPRSFPAAGRDPFPCRFRCGQAAVALDIRTAVGSLLRSLGASRVPSGVEPMAVETLATTSYGVPNLNVDCILKNTHIPVSFLRSVGASQNTFAIESFIDEMAYEAGEDPYKFRRKLLAHRPDFVAVLDTLAEKSDWSTPLPKGMGRGIAIVECYDSVVGAVAEVEVRRAMSP